MTNSQDRIIGRLVGGPLDGCEASAGALGEESISEGEMYLFNSAVRPHYDVSYVVQRIGADGLGRMVFVGWVPR